LRGGGSEGLYRVRVLQPLATPGQRTVIEMQEIRFEVHPDAALFEPAQAPSQGHPRP